jgi:hypothetical protein
MLKHLDISRGSEYEGSRSYSLDGRRLFSRRKWAQVVWGGEGIEQDTRY